MLINHPICGVTFLIFRTKDTSDHAMCTLLDAHLWPICYKNIFFAFRLIFSRRFSKKNADYSSDFSFFKTNEVTDFISFYNLVCSFVHLLGRLICRLREAGERGFETRTIPKIF